MTNIKQVGNLHQESTPNMDSPGKHMADARINKSISQEEIASLMYVTTRLVKTIEQDSYADKRIDIFMHSHIKRYCKIVNIDSSKVFAKLECMGFDSFSKSRTMPAVNHKRVASLTQAKAIKFYLITLFFIIASISILVIRKQPIHHRDMMISDRQLPISLPLTVAKPTEK